MRPETPRLLTSFGCGSLRVQTSGGAVTVANFAGDTKVESSGGRLKLANISGKLNGETSGGAIDAILSSPVAGDVRLETSAGAIRVVAPANAALNVDAETGTGGVTTDLPIANTKASRDSLKGTINGGGKTLVLRTGAGQLCFLDLAGDASVVTERVGRRAHHYMPASLVQSQYDALEPLEADEFGVVVDFTLDPEQIVQRFLKEVQ